MKTQVTIHDDLSAEYRADDFMLRIGVDADDYSINRVDFETSDPEEEKVLSRLVQVLDQCSLLEAMQHGGLKLEFVCRSIIEPNKAEGIMSVFNAGKLFQDLNALIKNICWELHCHLKLKSGINFYEAKTREAWLTLDDETRFDKINQVLNSFCDSCLKPDEAIQICHIERALKVYVAYQSNEKVGHRGHILMNLERWFRKELEPKIEVFQEELQDINSRRFSKES